MCSCRDYGHVPGPYHLLSLTTQASSVASQKATFECSSFLACKPLITEVLVTVEAAHDRDTAGVETDTLSDNIL